MREYTKKPKNQSRTLDSNPKASRQAPIDVILQRYKERNIQRYSEDESEELIQGKFESDTQTEQQPVQRGEKPNNTGLPDNLKTGIENLSGYSMDDVKVHYNSDKPTQLNALAYAQGTDIHVAPRQEKHLPHEAWHVVQQMQGRVQPTMQTQGVNVNDSEGLEREADVMGKKSMDSPSTIPIFGKSIEISSKVIQGFGPFSKLIGIIRSLLFVQTDEEENDDSNSEESITKLADTIETSEENPVPETAIKDEQESLPQGKNATSEQSETSLNRDGLPGDCLYTAVSQARGNANGIENELRQIATTWLLYLNQENEIFQFGKRDAMIGVVSTPQEWTGGAGDLSAVVLAYSQNIQLHVTTETNTFIFNPDAQIIVRIYYSQNHYTVAPTENHKKVEKSVYALTDQAKERLTKLHLLKSILIGTTNKDENRILGIINEGIERGYCNQQELSDVSESLQLNKCKQSESKQSEKKKITNSTDVSDQLGKGDFYLTGISQTAGDNKNADEWIIKRFESAIKTGKLQWSQFKGSTHNNVTHPTDKSVTFKAHYSKGKAIKLYLDQSNGKASKLRAIYSLKGTQLHFERFEEHP